MVRQINPFIYGKPVPPSHFVGREAVIDHCYNRLAGPVRTSIAISGEHGIGKTSLLYFLKYLAEKEEWGRAARTPPCRVSPEIPTTIKSHEFPNPHHHRCL